VYPDEPLRVELQLSRDAPESGGFNCYIYTLNDEAFLEGYEYFKTYSWQINDDAHSDTQLSGKITAPVDGLLYTSIPFDTGWQVTVDGTRMPKADYAAIGDGAFLAIPLKAGDHDVTFKFVPPGLREGIMISGAALVLLGLLGVLMELRRRRQAEGEKLRVASPWLSEPPMAGYIPTGSVIDDYPSMPPEAQAAAPLFSAEGLQPEDFALTAPEPAPEEPAQEESLSAENHATEDRFHLTLPDPDTFEEDESPQDLSAEAAQPTKNIQVILQELQERAAALQEKVGPPEDNDQPGFRLES